MLSVRSPVLSWTVTVAKGCPSVSRTVPRRLAGFSWPWRTSDARTQAAKRAGRCTAEVEVIVAEIVPRPRSLENASWRTHPREHLERKVGRTPWSAADAHVGVLGKVGSGGPARTGASPHSAANGFHYHCCTGRNGNTLATSIDTRVDVRPTPRPVSAQQTESLRHAGRAQQVCTGSSVIGRGPAALGRGRGAV